ncbi:MAG: transglycosylase domain-containing protein [Candidatus Hinthialibacter antarcticus]|nr:transglycosylase domain-containing protein [Candidatus Hinthialibacter antarcticus]
MNDLNQYPSPGGSPKDKGPRNPLPPISQPPGMAKTRQSKAAPRGVPTNKPSLPIQKPKQKASKPTDAAPLKPTAAKAAPARPVRKRSRLWRIFFVFFALLALIMGGAVGLTVGYFDMHLAQLPVNEFLEEYQPAMPSQIFSGDDKEQLIANFYSDTQNREMAPLSEMPKYLPQAVIALEDRRFYEHSGISLPDIIRAIIYDIKTWTRTQGASTITIQLAEDLINNDKVPWPQMPKTGIKAFERKYWEWKVALQIEKRYTKNEILEIYLNQVFLGDQAYGVARGAEYYFGKNVSDLTIKECALFAGMLQAPNRYSPAKNPERALTRTATVLRAMLRDQFITQTQYDQALAEPFTLKQGSFGRNQIALYPYFSWEIERQFKNGNFVSNNAQPLRIKGKGIDVKATIDVDMQEAAEAALQKGIEEHERRMRYKTGMHWGEPGYRGVNRHTSGKLQVGSDVYDARILTDYDPETKSVTVTLPNVAGGEGPFTLTIDETKAKWDEFDILKPDYYLPAKAVEGESGIQLILAKEQHVQGALVAVQPSTGKVLAMVGGYDYNDKTNSGNFIRATMSTNVQPGSAYKPFVMAAALAEKDRNWTLASILQDIKHEYWTGWTPRNFYNRYFGGVTMRYTLVHSLNAASVWLLDNYKGSRMAGIQNLVRFSKNFFGLRIEKEDLSISLGSAGASPYEMAQAYSVLANRGDFVRLHMVDKVYQRQDSRQKQPDLLYEFDQPLFDRKRLSPELAYLVTYLLRGVVEDGTADEALELPFWSVGKTGTTDECTYAWYAGYSNDMLCIVYMGFDDYTRSLGNKMTGSRVALPIWMDFMQQAYDLQPQLFGEIPPPPGIEFYEICDLSGQLAVDECMNVKDERSTPALPVVHSVPFIAGTAPTEPCPLHRRDEGDLRPYQRDAYQLILNAYP